MKAIHKNIASTQIAKKHQPHPGDLNLIESIKLNFKRIGIDLEFLNSQGCKDL